MCLSIEDKLHGLQLFCPSPSSWANARNTLFSVFIRVVQYVLLFNMEECMKDNL